jgi:hypothetical protein
VRSDAFITTPSKIKAYTGDSPGESGLVPSFGLDTEKQVNLVPSTRSCLSYERDPILTANHLDRDLTPASSLLKYPEKNQCLLEGLFQGYS